MASEVGVAYVRLLPAMEGFSAAVSRQMKGALSGPARKAGKAAGTELGSGIGKGVDGQSGKLSGVASKVGDIFKVGLAAAGLAAGAVLTAGLSQALDAEAAKDKLAAQLGGGDFGQEAGEIAGRLYTEAFGASVADTAGAVQEVLTSGILAEDEFSSAAIEDLTRQALTFSDVLDQDLNMSLQAVDRMLATGLASSADEAFDILAAGVQKGVDRSGDLTETFQEYSTMFRDIGLDGSEAMGLLSLGLQAGARDADTVADALKEFAIRAQDGSTASAAGFEAIGLSADEMTAAVARGGPEARAALDQVLKGLNAMEDPAARNAAAVALFGTKAEDLGDALFNLDLDRAALTMHDSAGAAEGLGSAYDNAQTKITAFKRRAMDRIVDVLGNQVIPFMERAAEVVGPILQGAFAALGGAIERIDFERLSSIWSEITGAVEAALAALQPAADWLSNNREVMVGAITAVAIAITALLIPALIGMVAPVIAAAAPFVAAGAAIAALGGAIAWAYQNVDWFRQLVDTALPAIADAFQTGFAAAVAIVETAVAVVSAIWNAWGDEIVQVASIAFNLIAGVVQGGFDIVVGIVRTVTALLRGDWSAAWEGIQQITRGVIRLIGSIVRAGLDSIQLAVKVGFRIVRATITAIMSAVASFVRARIDAMVGFFRGLPGRVRSAFSTLASAITAPFRSAFNGIRNLWNRTAGGFGFSIPDWIPKIGGKSFKIPRMHSGGIVPGTGDVPILAKGGEGLFTQQQMANLAPVSTLAPGAPTRVILSADGESRYLDWLRHTVRVVGGGDVQRALGA